MMKPEIDELYLYILRLHLNRKFTLFTRQYYVTSSPQCIWFKLVTHRLKVFNFSRRYLPYGLHFV